MALERSLPGLASLAEAGLVDTIEEKDQLQEGVDVSSLPVAVLEASTALFGPTAAPLMRDGASDGLTEALGSLKQRLDGLIEAGGGAKIAEDASTDALAEWQRRIVPEEPEMQSCAEEMV